MADEPAPVVEVDPNRGLPLGPDARDGAAFDVLAFDVRGHVHLRGHELSNLHQGARDRRKRTVELQIPVDEAPDLVGRTQLGRLALDISPALARARESGPGAPRAPLEAPAPLPAP